MSVLANIVIAAFFLENDDFVAFHEGTFHLANDFCPFFLFFSRQGFSVALAVLELTL